MTAERFRPPRQPLVGAGQIEHHVSDMTMTASAELSLESLQTSLAQHDQWLPIDGDPKLPLSRLVEINSTGPLRLGYGAWRDLLLGMQITTPSGRLVTAGGRTMKNVAGYDLTKFMVGQHGLFGRIVTITTRTYRRPNLSLLVKLEPSDRVVGQLLPTSARPHWAMLAEGFLWCGYLGDPKAIAHFQTEMQSRQPLEVRQQSLAQDIEFRAQHWILYGSGIHYRAAVPPCRIVEFVRQAAVQNYAADPAFGVVVGSCVAEAKNGIRSLASAMGGSVQFDDPDDVSAFFGAKGEELALLNRVKSAFEQ